jgi:hypothetical protein
MNCKRWISLWALPLFILAVSCKKAETPVVESKSETKATSADGTRVTTSTEEKQVGSTLEATTETSTAGKGGGKTESETVVGTVTAFEVGRKITVLTGDGTKHDYDLTKKDTSTDVDARVAVGSKIRLDSTKEATGRRTIRVGLAPAR